MAVGIDMKKAYVTTLCNGEGYLPGVEVLGRSLEVSGSREMRIVLVTPDVEAPTRERLTSHGWQVRDVQSIVNPVPRA